jgi:formiminotetrahydrofolate cyclodeaminase
MSTPICIQKEQYMTELRHQSVQQFLDQLASATPTPGGGSVAALSGALAAGLITMVCDLTIGRPRYADFDAECQQIRQQTEHIRAELTGLIQADIDAYSLVAAAYKRPKDDPERAQAIVDASVVATDIPLQIAEHAAALLPLALPVAHKGNKSAVGDVIAAAHLAQATVHAALINVTANIGVLTGHPRQLEFVTRQQAAVAHLAERCQQVVDAGSVRL